MLSVLPPTNQTRIATNHVVAGCVKLLHKVESGSSLCNNICICCAFYRCSKWRHSRVLSDSYVRGRQFNSWGGGEGRGGWFWKKFPASAWRKKKIGCSENVIESLWVKKGKNYPAHQIARKKKFLMTRNHPTPRRPFPQELNGRPLIYLFIDTAAILNWFDLRGAWARSVVLA